MFLNFWEFIFLGYDGFGISFLKYIWFNKVDFSLFFLVRKKIYLS